MFFNYASEKEVRSPTKFHEPLNFVIKILSSVFALHPRAVGTSPLMEHDAMMPFFIMAVVIYGTAFLGIKLGPQNAGYIPILQFVCVTCAIVASELLASSLVDPLRLLVINICGILVELLRRWYKQILTWKFNRFSFFGDAEKQDQDAGDQIADHIV